MAKIPTALTIAVSNVTSSLISDKFDYYKFGIYLGVDKRNLEKILIFSNNNYPAASVEMIKCVYSARSDHWNFLSRLLRLLESSVKLNDYKRIVANTVALRFKNFFPSQVNEELIPSAGSKTPADFSCLRLILIAMIHLIELTHGYPGVCETVCRHLVSARRFSLYNDFCKNGDCTQQQVCKKLLMFHIFADTLIVKGTLKGCDKIREAYAQIVSLPIFNKWVNALSGLVGIKVCDLSRELFRQHITMRNADKTGSNLEHWYSPA